MMGMLAYKRNGCGLVYGIRIRCVRRMQNSKFTVEKVEVNEGRKICVWV